MFTSRWCQETQALKHNTIFFPFYGHAAWNICSCCLWDFRLMLFFFLIDLWSNTEYCFVPLIYNLFCDFDWSLLLRSEKVSASQTDISVSFFMFFSLFFFKVNIKKLYMGLHSTSIKRWKMPNWCDFEQDVTMLLVEESREISLDIQVHLREHRE